jgi:hypothetical protein
MIYCLDQDYDFFKYILNKSNIKFIQTDNPTDQVLLLHTPYPWDIQWEFNTAELMSKARQVIVFCTEVHDASAKWLQSLEADVIVFVSGRVHKLRAQQYPYMDWFATTTHFYKTRLHILENLHNKPPLDDEKAHFNALLGRKKLHRDLIYKQIKDNKQVLCTYMQTQHEVTQSIQQEEQFIWECEQQPVNWTIDKVEYDGELVSLSQILPVKVYEKTNWCIVAETNYDRNFVFLTEKIAKPIMAKMPFLIIGNPNSLDMLRSLGFKTFDGIIDESYDRMPNLYHRIDAVVKVIEDLHCDQKVPQQILDHNYKILMNTDWHSINRSYLKYFR